MVKNSQHGHGKVVELYKKWRSLEGGSRRQDRAMSISFLEKQEQLRLDLNLLQDIMKLEAENIIQRSGIVGLREEVEYLKNQMTREQIGCPVSWDTQQKKRMSGE